MSGLAMPVACQPGTVAQEDGAEKVVVKAPRLFSDNIPTVVAVGILAVDRELKVHVLF
jgi:hypothetical protein